MWQQCGDVACPVGRQACQDVVQISTGLVAVELRRADEAHDGSRMLASAQRPGEEPIGPADGPRTYLVFHPVMPTPELCRIKSTDVFVHVPF
ncbi:hypothetical protein BG61_04530 [Caballeronia glathei]|uniref:Uncharacterized protein n=1 Tax=Caballeronia glathei TaxID=60547 RepID=A0A069PC04_9BURK|nr:hypothetical protein BG61_04530 [Caballeronia glathei]